MTLQTTSATFQINNAKDYVPVVTLSINDNIKFLQNIKQVFKRTISWNKYRSKITTQSNNNNLDYLIDPIFRNINRLFVLSFKNGGNQNYYRLIGKDLSRQTNMSIPQQINFVGKIEKDNGATMFFIAEKQQKTILNFSLDSLIVTE